MLSDVNNIKKKYNIENLEISAKDLFEFEKNYLKSNNFILNLKGEKNVLGTFRGFNW